MSGSRRAIRPVEAALLCALAFGVSTPARADWAAVSAGSMTVARGGHTATLLHDGRVLIVGGCTSSAATSVTNSAEIYDPSTGTFRETGSMAVARLNHKATLLDDGSVLITGGVTLAAKGRPVAVASAEVYDPRTERFSAAGNMAGPRAEYTATRLQDGKVLIAGGMGWANAPALAVELYDPSTRTFSMGASMAGARREHTATLLSDGRVLLAGGTGGDPGHPVTLHTVEVYANGTFSPLPNLAVGRGAHTATLLAGSRILFAGGNEVVEDPPSYRTCLASAELYDARSGSVSVLRGGAARCLHSAAQVSTGDVLLIGGSRLSSVTRFDVSKGTLVESGPMLVTRAGAGATVLAGDTVLITGGTVQTALAELYRNAPGPSMAVTPDQVVTPDAFGRQSATPTAEGRSGDGSALTYRWFDQNDVPLSGTAALTMSFGVDDRGSHTYRATVTQGDRQAVTAKTRVLVQFPLAGTGSQGPGGL